jgi:uncharacterized protein (DUF4415 family)
MMPLIFLRLIGRRSWTLAQFKAKGPKWQTRINDALREWLKQAG